MYKYKLAKKINPQDRQGPQKWYATAIGEESQSVKAMTRAATKNTTMASGELESALQLFGDYARQQLLQGHIVRLGDLGTLRITFKSAGVEDITDFNASSMITNPRIVFTPSKEFRNSVIQDLQFQNAGVLEDGINYATLADYKRAKGIVTTPDDSEEEEGGEQGGGGSPIA